MPARCIVEQRTLVGKEMRMLLHYVFKTDVALMILTVLAGHMVAAELLMKRVLHLLHVPVKASVIASAMKYFESFLATSRLHLPR